MFKGFVYLGFFFFCVGGSPVFATTEDSDSWLAQNAEVELGGRPDAVQHSAAMQQKADYLPSAATVGTDVGANGESPQDATTAVQDPTPVTVDPSSAGVFSVQPVDPGLSYGGSTGFGGNQALLAGGTSVGGGLAMMVAYGLFNKMQSDKSPSSQPSLFTRLKGKAQSFQYDMEEQANEMQDEMNQSANAGGAMVTRGATSADSFVAENAYEAQQGEFGGAQHRNALRSPVFSAHTLPKRSLSSVRE